ncbi:circularly permuted type 2 ATP-grasp protein [Limnohabitans sp. INBF002]|uniref:circularly permuted type 2 ATP-grasp protein n=1 Tax=Limnohabitans sp. INBF002 TaxID=2986280 RepID=UPI0024915AFA|nr:circularly permuted type 2 ATP-grasp protein [Limnohabitans sp. INBF002]
MKGLAHPADSGHFDELQGKCSPAATSVAKAMAEEANAHDLSSPWRTFFEQLGNTGLDDLDRRTQTLARQVRDNGITYNVYASQGGPQRPWALDLFPLIVTPESWQHIEVGVKQRARLLERMMADVYGPQQLIREAMIPPALVQGHPGYLRAMHGVAPVGGTHLHIAAFDLARGPDGHWAVVSQRTQAPSGLGYLLENRLLISRQFPQAFEAMNIQRLAATYRVWVESLKAHSPEGANAHVALLTPGPYNETYFEHAYLARYLGLTLVEGHDLTVRDERVYLRTLRGLEPVHVLLKRMDDEFLDPLELRADSTLGIPGLLQAVRAGNVVVANAPGSAFLESPALLGFLPALSEKLLGEELQLPALDTWWCGERAALASVLPQLEHMAIKPTYPGSTTHGTFDATIQSVLGRTLTQAQRDEWVGRITRQPDRYTLQAYSPLSQMPTWKNTTEGVVQRSVMLRVFALRNSAGDGPDAWRVLPGGLARIAAPDAQIASMQRGGSSADVWVQTHADIDRSSLLPKYNATSGFKHRERMVTSRAAENLYWLGRYTERSENMVRLVRLCIEALNGEDPASRSLWAWLQLLTQRQGLVPAGVPSAHAAGEDKANSTPSMGARRRVFERTLIACLDQDDHSTSVGYNLRALQQAASSLRERLSPEHWNAIVHCVDQFSADCAQAGSPRAFSAVQAMQALDAASSALAAITGAQTDRMTRDDGWQLLSIGRHVERLGFLSSALDLAVEVGAFEHTADDADSADENSSHYAALLSLFDSTITFQAQYQQSRELAPLIELLVQDNDNPRSLAWVARTLRGRLSKLANTPMGEPDALARLVPDLKQTDLEQLCMPNDVGHHPNLRACLTECMQAAWQVSDAITSHYFSHTDDADSVGA